MVEPASEIPESNDSSALGPVQREAALRRLAMTSAHAPLDVLVVGGGVVGCGAALDSVSRGLSTALVESDDLACGTSSRSSRLAHGGLRYLEQREFGLVHEALTERGLLLDRLAPHLVRPLPFVFPVTARWERSYVGAGVALYDALSRLGAYGGTMPRPRRISLAALAGIAPGLRREGLAGAVRFHDAQIDDARHTVAVARTASAMGAAVATGVKVTGLMTEELPEGGRRVVGAYLLERDTGRRLEVFARVVVGAVGVWTDELLAMVGPGDGPVRPVVRQSKGVHLVIPRWAFPSATAVIARTPHSVLFLLPWSEHWLVGTTDTEYVGRLDNPSVDLEDVDYLLDQANRWLVRPISRADVVGVYAGLRPLVDFRDAGSGGTTQVSREHVVLHPVPGLVAIAGGKYTTYRVMAADVIDAAVSDLPCPREVPSSATDELPLIGAEGYRAAWGRRVRTARDSQVPVEAVERLLRRHGDRTPAVLELIRSDPALGLPLHPQGRVIRAEAVIAARDEGARSLADILIRRTRLALQTTDRGMAAAALAGRLVAPILGWDGARIAEETARCAELQPAAPQELELP